MKGRIVTSVILGIFLFVTLFGLPVLLSHTEHHTGCPLQGAQTVMCENTVIEHASIWQMMLASIVGSLVLLIAFAWVVIARRGEMLLSHERYRLRLESHTSQRPTLFQELFSKGILNRKESYLFS